MFFGRTQEAFHLLLEVAPYAVVVVDERGIIVRVNELAQELFGYAQHELFGQPIEILVPERFRDKHRRYRARYMADPQMRSMGADGLDLHGRRRDGTEFPAEIALRQLCNDEGLFVVATIRDISNQKAKEDELRQSRKQLRELSARLLSAREEERTHIARVIHDELGQALTGLKMDVAWLQKHLGQDQTALLDKTEDISDLIDTTVQLVRRVSTDPRSTIALISLKMDVAWLRKHLGEGQRALQEKMGDMSDLIDTTVQLVRHLSSELRPTLLDDLGLVPTLEWQLRDFQTRTGIQCTLVCTLEETTLDAAGSTMVFRVFQEALTNVARHANATQVQVRLEETADHLILRVQDNGRGITDSEINDPKSFGLLGMRERALLSGGKVEIGGTPGKGTTVTVRLPLGKGRGEEEPHDKRTHRR